MVTDVQGIVALKPVLHQRWTPVCEHLVLRPGDWVRTDARGANATSLKLVKQVGVILGHVDHGGGPWHYHHARLAALESLA